LTSIREILRQASNQLAKTPEGSPELEAEILLTLALDKPRSHLHAWPDKELSPETIEKFQALVERRINGEPIAYIQGHREFWSLELQVSPETLIPRPETELLVEKALELIPKEKPFLVADLGTGSGAIAAAIASERPNCIIITTDSSADALAIAEANFRHLGLGNVICQPGEWYGAILPETRFDIILSNPPYIPDADPHLCRGDLPWEPKQALASGPDGLDAIRQIIRGAPQHLKNKGWLILEHGFDQGMRVRNLLAENGFGNIATHRDLAGLDRLSMGKINLANQ
jgi:release factor glutamine methyltransferase